MNKEIIINHGNLKDEEVTETNLKNRLIIMNDDGEILLENYAGVFLLPGGKQEDGENPISGLVREIREETGIDINNEKVEPLVKSKMYIRDYPKVNELGNVNRLSKTNYFYLLSNKKTNHEEASFDINEKKYNLTMEFIDINKAIKLVESNSSSNPRKDYFNEELLKVLEEFKQTVINKKNESKGLIDMHIHTRYSDGDFEPSEIVQRVKKAGISTFAITDHDTILGCKQLENFNEPGLTFIPGIELSAAVSKGRMHILGYNIDINNIKLTELLERKKNNSVRSLELMYQYIHNKYGVSIPHNEFNKLNNKVGDVGRPDLALLIIKYGYVNTMEQAFKKYLIEAFDATRENRITTSKEDCMNALKEAAAYISLAHPITLKMDYEELKKELIYLKSLGLDAIEICHSNQSEEYRNILRMLRDELNLYETGGSDYHGPNVKPDIELGTGRNSNVKIKELKLLNKMQN